MKWKIEEKIEIPIKWKNEKENFGNWWKKNMKKEVREEKAAEADRFEGELADQLSEPDRHYAHWG